MKGLIITVALAALTLVALPFVAPQALWEVWSKPSDEMTEEEYAELLRGLEPVVLEE